MDNSLPFIVLVRHGESVYNQENLFTGWLDIPLTERGRAEAHSATVALHGLRFDKAYSSALGRAIETLDIIVSELGLQTIPQIHTQALNERHYGDLQGLNKAETVLRFGEAQVHTWRRSYTGTPPGGESLKDTSARVMPYFSSVIVPDVREGANVLVVAHGNSLRAIIKELDHISDDEIAALNIPTGQIYFYTFNTQQNIFCRTAPPMTS
jgi:2,3-bisphosphoglycerate-dependent phosphoglycerate mutase